MNMDVNETWRLQSNISANNSSHSTDCCTDVTPIYVFTPVDATAKYVLCGILATIGSLGFLGNCLLLHFLRKKPKRTLIQRSPFVRNFNLYIRSLSLSDILLCLVSLPLGCIQILFDVFQSGWPCRVARYLNFIFPGITINNLIVISLEKYLSTRATPRTFSTKAVRRMIVCAWAFGMAVMLLPAGAYDGIRVDLNQTHFTTICFYNQQFYPFKITLIVVPVQYILPGIFITFVNVCLIRTVWVRGRRMIGNGSKNAFKAKMIATKMKGITLLILITFVFIITYFFYLGNIAYTQIAKPKRDFATEFMIRYGTGGIACLSSVMNVIIYFVQMSDFREFLKNLFCRSNNLNNDQALSMKTRTTARRDNGNEQLQGPVTPRPAAVMKTEGISLKM